MLDSTVARPQSRPHLGPLRSMASTGANASPGSPGHASRKPTPKTPGQKPGFLANTKREMRMEILGEGTPGPGSYLPASTFGKYSKSASSKMSKMQSSAFKSTSKQRPVNKATSVPGPGSHSPNHQATSREKKGVRARARAAWLACVHSRRRRPSSRCRRRSRVCVSALLRRTIPGQI